MRLELDLPTDLEAKLSAEADEVGLPLAEYVLRVLSAERNGHPPRTGGELLAYWQQEKLVGTRDDIADSSAHARKLRDKAQKRERP